MGISILAQVQTVPAENLNYGVDMGVGESDNVTLVAANKVSQTIAVADGDFSLQQQSRRLDLEARGNFSYLDFLQNAYSPELIGHFNGSGQFAIIPERLTWVLQDDFGQAQIDPFTPVTPSNRENINYVTTGPDVAFRIGSTAFVDVTGRYARAQYEVSPFNSDRFIGTLAVGIPLSARSTVSMDGTVERVLFDNTLLNVDFDRSSLFAHYALQSARMDLKINVGATTVTESGDSLTGPLAKVEVSRQLSGAAKLTFTAGRDLTDASAGFSALQSAGVGTGFTGNGSGTGVAGNSGPIATGSAVSTVGSIGTAPAPQASTNYAVTYGSVGWQYNRDRTVINANGRWEKDGYDGQPALDLNRADAELTFERRMTRALSAQVFGYYNRTQYAHVDFSERDNSIGGALIYREGRGLEVRLRYSRTSRNVEGIGSEEGIGSNYSENRAFLTVGYRPGKGRPQ